MAIANEKLTEKFEPGRVESILPVILFVDDYQPLLETFVDAFANKYVVLTANGIEACWFALEKHRPNAIVLDIDFSFGNGIDLCKELRSKAQLENVPIIMFSNSEDKQTIELAYAAGANKFVCKSASLNTLMVELKAIL